MPFTDEDLKKLKDLSDGKTLKDFGWFTFKKCDALLARLEAAEKLADWVRTWESHENCNTNSCECGLQKDIKKWRKVAGKGEE